DHFVVDEAELRRRRVHLRARRRERLQQRGVRPSARRYRERCRGDERDGERPPHRTRNVNGAVITCPPTRNCRNSRHVPGTGTSTPTFRWPGVAELPVTRAPPRML